MDVYFVPIGRDRFESYFEAPEHEGEPDASPGLMGRWRARFASIVRDIERERHEHAREGSTGGVLKRTRRRIVRWVAERVAEQRLLWNLSGAAEATLHVPADLDLPVAERLMRDAMRRDADRHLRMLAVHSLGLALSVPFVLFPGPNVFGYFFTFTVIGHFMAWRGARRAVRDIKWTLVARSELADIRHAFSLDTDARRSRIQEVAERLQLQRLAQFVERMAAPSA